MQTNQVYSLSRIETQFVFAKKNVTFPTITGCLSIVAVTIGLFGALLSIQGWCGRVRLLVVYRRRSMVNRCNAWSNAQSAGVRNLQIRCIFYSVLVSMWYIDICLRMCLRYDIYIWFMDLIGFVSIYMLSELVYMVITAMGCHNIITSPPPQKKKKLRFSYAANAAISYDCCL